MTRIDRKTLPATKLHQLCFVGDYAGVAALLDIGVSASELGRHEQMEFHESALHPDDAVWHNVPPLFGAIKGGHLEIVKLLCERGANVDEPAGGYVESVQYL